MIAFDSINRLHSKITAKLIENCCKVRWLLFYETLFCIVKSKLNLLFHCSFINALCTDNIFFLCIREKSLSKYAICLEIKKLFDVPHLWSVVIHYSSILEMCHSVWLLYVFYNAYFTWQKYFKWQHSGRYHYNIL